MTAKHLFLALFGGLLFAAFQPLHAQGPTVRQFVGVNLNAEDSWEKAKRFAHVREFHLWADDISTESSPSAPCPFEGGSSQKLRWNPSYNTNRYIDYDLFYKALPQKVLVVTQGAAPSMYGGGGFGNNLWQSKPICRNDVGEPGENFSSAAYHLEPKAYKQQTIWQSLFAARYGSAPVGGFPANFENIAANYITSPDYTGLGKGLVRHIENFNEHDAAWVQDGADGVNTNTTDETMWAPAGQVTTWFFRPEEYAAMLSANYDGHCKSAGFEIPGTLDSYWGIKNLSSNVQVVMSGTADLRQNYINLVIEEFAKPLSKAYRGACELPFDVVNMHHYPTEQHPAIGDIPAYYNILNGVSFFGTGRGTNPEAPNEMLKQRVRSTLTDGDKLSLGGKELWITELGYDSHDAEGQTNVETYPIGPFDRQTVQGQWLTRCIFELLASTSELTRTYLYRMQDQPGTGQFTHTGVVDKDAKPKKSWYHLMTQLNVVGDYNYVETPDDIDRTKFFGGQDPTNPGAPLPYDDPRIYKFLKGGDAQHPVFVLWAPRKENKTYDGMLFIPWEDPLNNPITKALKIEVQDFDENGKRTLIDSDKIKIGSHNGKTGFFILGLHLTETPLYIKLNGQKDISDPVAYPVENLQVSSLCCDAARLTWDMPTPGVNNGTVIGTWFQVYYAPISAFEPVPDPDPNTLTPPSFDLSKLITVEERLPGGFRECVITGLQAGVEYYFFVIPVRDVIANQSLVQGLLPNLPSQGNLIDHKHYVKGSVSNCAITPSDCLLSIENEGSIVAPLGFEAMLNETFGVGKTSAEKCAELATQPSGGIYMDPNGPLTLAFIVNFTLPKFLKAIYINHGTGGPGKIRIEIIEDCCDQWKLVKELDINGYNNWFVLANKQLNLRRVEKIRFTIIRNRAQNLLLPRIYICG